MSTRKTEDVDRRLSFSMGRDRRCTLNTACCDEQNSRKRACNNLHPVIGLCNDREPYPLKRGVRRARLKPCSNTCLRLFGLLPILYHLVQSRMPVLYHIVQYRVLYQNNFVPLFPGPHRGEQNRIIHCSCNSGTLYEHISMFICFS